MLICLAVKGGELVLGEQAMCLQFLLHRSRSHLFAVPSRQARKIFEDRYEGDPESVDEMFDQTIQDQTIRRCLDSWCSGTITNINQHKFCIMKTHLEKHKKTWANKSTIDGLNINEHLFHITAKANWKSTPGFRASGRIDPPCRLAVCPLGRKTTGNFGVRFLTQRVCRPSICVQQTVAFDEQFVDMM